MQFKKVGCKSLREAFQREGSTVLPDDFLQKKLYLLLYLELFSDKPISQPCQSIFKGKCQNSEVDDKRSVTSWFEY